MRDERTQSLYEFNRDLSTVSDESLRLELEQSYRIINALSSSYHDVYYANLETGNMRSYRYSRITQEMFGKQFENGDFETNLYTYVRKAVHPDDQELFEPVLTRASIKKVFERQDSYSLKYRVVQDGEIHYCRCLVVKILGRPEEFVFAFQNRDREMMMESEKKNDMKRRMDIVMSMVKMYDNSLYVNVSSNRFLELKISPAIREMIDKTKTYDSQLGNVIENAVSREYQAAMREFLDIHTINERMGCKNVMSLEFKGRTTGWSEAYLIVGNRDADGLVEDVFVATRGINEEKMQKLLQQEQERRQNNQLTEALRLVNSANEAKKLFLQDLSQDIRFSLDDIRRLADISWLEAEKPERISGECLQQILASLRQIGEISDVLQKMVESALKKALEE
ncbi:MAG: PAS domain-containing protein [Selenomonadaceae bacterium]|nr:PAS domain-containing protein [Selenomonadaceae bacterium]